MIKTIMVTGATSGIGLAVCRNLALAGYGIIGVGRCEDKCVKAVSELRKRSPNTPIMFFSGDLMQQSQIFKIGSEIIKYLNDYCDGRLYALINNVGCIRSYFSTTEEGYEQQFALNHLTAFLLTHILMPYLVKSNGRILVTSSGSHKMTTVRWNDIMFKKRYNPLFAYKQSKLCNLLFVYALNERFKICGISAYGVDPGLVRTDIGLKQTNGLVKAVWKIRQKKGVSPEIPAKTYEFLCNESKKPASLYYYLCKNQKYSKQVNKNNADRLWDLSEKLCNIKFGKVE